jgi:uncharacterized protein with GYD domain
LFFIVLAKMRGEMTAEFREINQKTMKNPPPGIKIHNVFYTLGQYDFVIVYEAPSEKDAMKMGAAWAKFVESQTLTAIPQEEAQKLFK